MNEVRLRLAQEDAVDVAAGTVISHEMKPAAFIEVGLNLEEQQCVVQSPLYNDYNTMKADLYLGEILLAEYVDESL